MNLFTLWRVGRGNAATINYEVRIRKKLFRRFNTIRIVRFVGEKSVDDPKRFGLKGHVMNRANLHFVVAGDSPGRDIRDRNGQQEEEQ